MRVLLAGLRALQACCVAAGFVKYAANQELVCELVYGAMAALVGLLGDPTQPPIVRAETALALGCVALGNHGRFWVKIFAGSVATGGGAWPFPVIAAVCDILPTSSGALRSLNQRSTTWVGLVVGWRFGSRVIRSHSLEFQVRWPCAIYFRLPLHSLCLSLPLEVAPLNTVRGLGDRCKLQAVSSPAGSEAEPRRKSNFVHFSLKIWHLVASNLLFFSEIS